MGIRVEVMQAGRTLATGEIVYPMMEPAVEEQSMVATASVASNLTGDTNHPAWRPSWIEDWTCD
jgi:hypothetical protein